MINPFTEDPIFDLDFPADQAELTILSNGNTLNGVLEIAQGKGPHPTIILLHGYPGNEKNGDLAHLFRRAGLNVLIFHYQGSWGSQGNYSIQNCLDDCNSAIEFIRTHYKEFRIDRDKISLIGHSFGGFFAIYTAFFNPHIYKVVSISGADMIIFAQDKKNFLSTLNLISNPLTGSSPDLLHKEIMKNQDLWNLIEKFNESTEMNLLLIAAERDTIFNPNIYHIPMIESLKLHTNINLSHFILNTTHAYSDHRVKLAKVILDWLIKN